MKQYVLAHNGTVINGPRVWNGRSFETTLEEDLEITFKLPIRKEDEEIIEIDENTKIYSAELVYQDYNSLSHYLHGPFWDYSTGKAIGTFQPVENSIELIKGTLKANVASNRWTKEVVGFKKTIQDIEVTIDTSREKRNQFSSKYTIMADDEVVNWKFSDQWIQLSKDNVLEIAKEIDQHIQQQFNWETEKIAEINQCETVDQLLLVDVGNPRLDIPREVI
jgi:hypothetical protein